MGKHRELPPGYAMRLPVTAQRYMNIRSLIEVGLVLVALLSIAILVLPHEWQTVAWITILAGGVIGIFVDLPIVNRIIVRNTSYEADGNLIRIQRGVLFHRDLTISAAQILTVSIVDGPLLRRYSLVNVRFTTIAHTNPLGPMTRIEAERLRAHVLGVLDAHMDGQ